ncbi:MAG: histone deacetylase family protein [Candidatus Binatia bacterium]
MERTAVVVDQEYLKHLPGDAHPERPERIQVLLDLAARLDQPKFTLLPPRAASRAEVEQTHGVDHVRLVESTSTVNHYALDGDTITSRDSFGVALLAVGGFLNLLDSIAAKESANGIALVRPPGHHALRNRAMGFCLFNTMAIGAEYLKRQHGAKKIMIVDWDVHHGNGTQDAFYDDPSVLFVSTHQFPYYPGTGAVTETGGGAGAGYTINVPLPAGCADREYLQVFQDIIVPAAEKFRPEWVLVSAGFDPHRRDPLGGMDVTEQGFGAMTRTLLAQARKFAGGRIALLLEGGYDLAALRNSVAAVLAELQAPEPSVAVQLPLAGSGIEPVVRRVLQVHENFR